MEKERIFEILNAIQSMYLETNIPLNKLISDAKEVVRNERDDRFNR